MRPVRRPLQYLDNEHTFTPGMAKREGPLVFAGAPIVQGRWDGTGTPDALTFPRGMLFATNFRANADMNQATAVLWITPEWEGDDGLAHGILRLNANLTLSKAADDTLLLVAGAESLATDISAWNAGTTYMVAASWDIHNTIDGANYLRLSIDDVHAFGATAKPSPGSPLTVMWIGSLSGVTSADAIIEGFHLYRRVLYDGEFGVDAGNGDEIARIYAGGVGLDPTLVTGSWGVVFALPTDSAVGAMVTG